MKKDLEFEESRKLKNMIRGLDDDEVEYLDYVDQRKLSEERKKFEEEKSELKDFREQVAELQQKSFEEKSKIELANAKPKTQSKVSTRPSQKAILSSLVKRRAPETATNSEPPVKKKPESTDKTLKCVAILPGLGTYNSSESSDDSSDSDTDESPAVDWVGRKLTKKKSCDDDDDD
jgi:hypothetical protein